MNKATAYANANIAVVKYWGKSNSALNIPALSSLSMTLDQMGTTVTLSSSPKNQHILLRDGRPCDGLAYARFATYLEQIRTLCPYTGFLSLCSKSSVPYGAGLASSAAFFAALTKALDCFLELKLSETELSKIARLGSGSAARSMLGGWVGLYGGLIEHDQAYAFPVQLDPELKLTLVVAIVDGQPKVVPSRQAMNETKASSPFFAAWLNSGEQDFLGAMNALRIGSLADLGAIMEHSTLKMHACMWASKPSINYLSPKTLAIMNLVYELRRAHGPIAYFTMDAGPNVKILCESHSVDLVVQALAKTQLSQDIRLSHPGEGARLLHEHLL